MTTPKNVIELLFCLLLIGQSSSAQDKFIVHHYGTEDGLPSNGIKGLQWDEKTRFLWIATEAGFVRYNGLAFKSVTTEDEIHTSDRRTWFLTKNNSGTIYGGDEAGYVFEVKGSSLRLKEGELFNTNSSYNRFLLRVSDQLFRHAMESRVDPKFSMGFEKTVPINDSSCLIIMPDTLYLFSLGLKAPVRIPLDMSIANGFLIDNMVFLVDEQQRFFKFEPRTNRLSPISIVFDKDDSPSQAHDFLIWHNGMKSPLLIKQNFAWQLHFADGRLQAEMICDVVPTGAQIMFAQFNEQSRKLFLSTDSKGMYLITKNDLESLTSKMPSMYGTVSYYSQIELPNGNVLTSSGHVVGKNPEKNIELPIDSGFEKFVYKSGDSLLWYTKLDSQLGHSFLHKYDLRTRKTTALKKSFVDYQAVIAEAAHRLYVINVFGLWRLEDDSLVSIDDRIQATNSGLAFDMKEISPGKLGIATCSTFLSYDIAERRIDTIFNSKTHCVRTIWLYKDYIFFGTYGNGLYAYKNGKLRALPLDRNRYLLFTHCFVEDDFGFCWLSTNRGLFKVKIDDLIAAFESGKNEIYYHYFGKDNGMSMTEMNGGCVPCGITLKNKTISFPSMEGLVWVYPERVEHLLANGNIYIDEFKVNGKRINPDSLQEASLPASNGEIEIRFSFTAWDGAENVYVSYFLDDSTNWKKLDANEVSTLRFLNLQPGEHHLRIKKSNGFGIDNFTYKDIRFVVAAPWYRTWWFYLLAVLAVFGIVWAGIRIRTRQYREQQFKLEQLVYEKTKELWEKNAILEKNDDIKTRLISIINHDIITPLKFLAATGNKLVQRKDMMSPELLDETIIDMSRTSKELQTLSTNILNWIKYQNEGRGLVKDNFDLQEMAEQVMNVLGPIAHQKDIDIINDVEAGTQVFQFLEPLKILLYNIVSNAIRFSNKGSIVIASYSSGDYTTLSVSDEGIGMAKEQIENITSGKPIIQPARAAQGKGHGLGYLIIRDLLKVTGASLGIDSEPGAGTTVYIRFQATEQITV